ncbi:MAG: SCP2 sterol-binding domain-containing protein [Candidatus Thorarchaeota archaeon]
MSDDDLPRSLERSLIEISNNINNDNFMLMEYLGPVVDGCRAALNVSIDKALELSKMSEDDFDEHISSVSDSFRELTICMKVSDIDEEYSVVFDRGKVTVHDECIEPDVIIVSDSDTLISLFNSDPKLSPTEILGNRLKISGDDSLNIVEGLGFLCYPSLLRVAKSGIDPSSILSEDADSVIMVTASDLVVKMIRKWIDTQLSDVKI